MARPFSIGPGLLVAIGLCLGGTAWGQKPRIAVLGLEAPIAPGATHDPGAQLVAREITKELRQRMLAPGCPYETAPNSDKELLDEKLLMSCETETLECMVVIGAGLASDAVLYGRVDKRGETFRVSLKLLDVKRRTIQQAVDDLPVGGAAAGVSRRLFRKLIGDGPGEGTLIVKARSDAGVAIRGTVVVDKDPKGVLVGGKLTVTGVSDGRHTVTIDASGFVRFEEIVTVKLGEPVTINAQLHRIPVASTQETAAAPRAEHSVLWKWGVATGAAVALGGGGFAFYSDWKANHSGVMFDKDINPDTGRQYEDTQVRAPTSGDCGHSNEQIRNDTHTVFPEGQRAVFDHACSWNTRTYIGIGTAVGGGLLAITSLIILSSDPGPAESSAAGSRGKKPDVAIAPILTPQVTGAQLTLSW